MFLKKLLSMATKSETLACTTETYKMYDTTFGGKRATKLVFTQFVEPYAFLKKIKHDTLISLYKLNVEKKSLTTERILPFNLVLKKDKKEFNRYILLKIALALEFLHKQCEILHGNVSKESLFFGEDGRVILGGFEKSKKSKVFDEDSMMFSNLLGEILEVDMSLAHFVENNGFCSEMFFDLEITFFGYRSFTTEQKQEFVCEARRRKDEFIDIHKRRIAWMVLNDFENKTSKEFKVSAVDFIMDFGLPGFEEFLPALFSILDTDVRLYLLRNCSRYIGGLSSLDVVVKSLSLGIKCKDKQLRAETIRFIRENMDLISKKKQICVLDVMYGYVSDDEGILLVLEFLCVARPVFKKSDIVYRILCKYLLQSRSKLEVLATLELFYKGFDNFKMTTELLPLLCGYLSDKHTQMATFSLIDKILQHLKEHKAEIVDNEWKIGKIGNFFRPKLSRQTSAAMNVQVAKETDPNDVVLSKESEEDDGWDEPW